MMKIFHDLSQVVPHAKDLLLGSHEVEIGPWQGTSDFKSELVKEQINYIFQVPMPHSKTKLQSDLKADQPWAEDHFQERVLGHPLNPGTSYLSWPYNKFNDGDKFLKGGMFSHSYMERYWPKRAGWAQHGDRKYHNKINAGIWYNYGDLWDVIELIKKNPMTRQAYLPVWFPEDTGAVHGERVPCSIGYHFLIRGHHLHLNYYIRSCDFYRHFKNDIYLTIRLAHYVLEKTGLTDIKPGFLTMHIGSFHLFKNDTYKVKKENY